MDNAQYLTFFFHEFFANKMVHNLRDWTKSEDPHFFGLISTVQVSKIMEPDMEPPWLTT